MPGKSYFLNGQIKHVFKPKQSTAYDTSISYYSTGQIREMKVSKNGNFSHKKQQDLNYHSTMFYQHIRMGDTKAAHKNFYQLWLMDSTNIDTYFKEGLLLATEHRFDEAITLLDRALVIEPMMREALEQRALARLKRFKYGDQKIPRNERVSLSLVLEDIMLLPEEDEVKVCRDLLLADELDPGVNYNSKPVPAILLTYCKRKSSR